MPSRPLTLMAVHAHPDDEAISTGGVLAKAASDGARTVLVVCTDGRCGDGPGGVKPGEPGHDPDAVVEMRRAELDTSCATLNITQLEMLGYADSGMMGWATNDAPDAFWNTPVDAAAKRLADLIHQYEPDVIVTYDEYGFYGHPDHIQAHRVTMAAVEAAGSAAKVYWTTAPRSMMADFEATMREFGSDWDEGEVVDGEVQIGLPDDEITTWVDVAAYGSQKFAALMSHASQSDNIFFVKMGEQRFIELLGVETFVRVRDTTGAVVPEADLFDGLRPASET